ncbi:sensor histidine kinase [Phytohabitans houttuyneae]|uniref:histidine kinase n=1 Tax=Phytohabitans houttuyneae TaxID=1076126 RepID=A0A6V8KCW5_9ACTN|nr:histidine kinase [Phytohabitans houttuyneae]GFJ83092.1 two-component sensor histidine kinase [Phytohabitans houttuyneae]
MVGAVTPEYRALLPGALLAEPYPETRGPVRRTARDWVVDVFLFLFAVAVAVGMAALSFEEGVQEGRTLIDFIVGVLCCVGLWWRRRWPVAICLIVTVAGIWSATSIGAALVAFFTVAVHRRFVVALAVAVVGVATGFLFPLLRPEWGSSSFWVDFAWATIITALVLAWGLVVRARRQLVHSLRDRAHRAESEQQLRVAQARQAERTRIAREMHDVLAHRISLLSLHAGALEFRPDAPPAEVARAAGVIRASAHEALQELREVIGVLREDPAEDAPDRPQPTLADLPGLVDESRLAGMRVRLDRRVDDLGAVPVAVGRNAYRIVQEGLTNARKHAYGSTVDVIVTGAAGDGLSVEVRNPWPVGVPAGPEIPGTGTGIVGLTERATLAGGRLEHGRTPSGDFRLWAWLPWPA